MNKLSALNIQYVFLLITLTLVLVSCGPDKKHFAIDGQLLNLNQGEFVIYSPDGAMPIADTISINGGRFSYEGLCQREGTAIIILPNGQDIALFIAPGKTYTINGNAQNLKEVTVKGEKENELMNVFRKEMASQEGKGTPTTLVRDIVSKNPESAVSLFLVRRYLVDTDTPDYKTAASLLDAIQKARHDDAAAKVLGKRVEELKKADVGIKLPQFSATDINGKTVSSSSMEKGIWLVCTFASWDFETTNKLRRIKSAKSNRSANWNILAVSFDADKNACKQTMRYDANDYTIVCDGKMAETEIASKLAMHRFPYAIIIKDGTIIKRSVIDENLMKYIENELKTS